MPRTPPPAAEKSYFRSAALVASVLIVALVLLLGALGSAEKKPLGLVANPPPGPPDRPTVDPATVAVASADAPAPASSSVTLSAIPSAAPPVIVFVSSIPPGATVSSGGRPLGFTPGPVTVPADTGKVALTVSAIGYQPSTIDVVPAAGKRVDVVLKKKAASRPQPAPSPR